MTRRMAMFLGMLSGGLLPARLLAQDDFGPREPSGSPRGRRPPPDDDLASFGDPVPAAAGDERAIAEAPPGDVPVEPGRVFRSFPIDRYTGLPHVNGDPQNALIEWIFRHTGSAAWHGEDLAMLNVGRTQLRAYHSPEMLRKVEQTVRRFTDATADVLSLHIRFVLAPDPRWRYVFYSRLNPLERGPQGQQVWTLSLADAAMLLAQMQQAQGIGQGVHLEVDESIKLINGQTYKVQRTFGINYVAGTRREGPVGYGAQPEAGKLEEGVILRLSPLLNYDGDQIELALDLQTTVVHKLHSSRILVPREIGAGELNVDVPEASGTRLNRVLADWPLGQTLLISTGIQPGLLLKKTGPLNLRIPGLVPTETELLVMIDAEVSDLSPRASRDRDRPAR